MFICIRKYSLLLIFLTSSIFNTSCIKGNSRKGNNDTINAGNSTDPTEILSRNKIPFDKFIGVNGFHEDDVNNIKAAGLLRAYCNWDWFQGDNPNDQLIFQNSRGGWYFDDAFKKIKDAGITIAMCFQGAIKNLHGTGNFKFNDKPVDKPGLSTTDPVSYTAISHTLFQIAARYGKTKVAANKLNVPASQAVSGLDLIEYIEVWNEPDKDWEGKNAQFSPQEYAAMLSACYDKIKEADPHMKVVMGGLATLSIDYIKGMKVWFEANRADKKFAADVINMHIYAFNNNINWSNPVQKPAETPEDALFKNKTAALVKYCEKNIPQALVWISEFGWDTNPESVLSPKKIAGLSANEVQARWIIRAFLEFAAARTDHAQVFALTDPSQNYISTWFGTSGLTDRTQNFKKKESWYYTSALKNTLQNMAFAGEQKASDKNVLIYKFKNLSGDNGVYAVWCKTSENKIISNFSLPVSVHAKKAEKIELVPGKDSGEKSSVIINEKKVTLRISEKPVFISVDNIL